MGGQTKAGKVIAIINEKGGVGKTHTTIQLGLILAELGNRILVIDNDSSFDATTALTGGNVPPEIYEAFRPRGVANTINLYTKDMPVEPVNVRENLDLMGASEKLVTVSGEDAAWAFVDSLEVLAQSYDYILIDCPPSIGPQSSAALKASDAVLIPSLPETFSYKGAVTIMTRIKAAQKREKKAARLLGVFISRLKRPMANSVRDLIELMQQDFGPMLFTSQGEPLAISETVKQSDAMAQGLSVLESAPNSNAAIEMMVLVEEIMSRLKNIEKLNEEYLAFTDAAGRQF